MMLEKQDLVESRELTCRGSTWILLGLSFLDIQAPRLPCLQPGDQNRFGERPHCRREEKRMGWDGQADKSYSTPLQDPLRPTLLVGMEEVQVEAQTAISNRLEQRQEKLQEATAEGSLGFPGGGNQPTFVGA